jgi:23S rRNA (adenine2503-C2)-methyltransferase
MEKLSLLAHTQRSYSEVLFALVGKGKQHAERLYAELFRCGHLEPHFDWVEPQAQALVRRFLELTELALPEISSLQEDRGVSKFLLRLSDGLESESVLIPMESGTTLCISSQVGCKMGCAFCETGKMGLIRSLQVEEIVSQVFMALFRLNHRVRNIVFMGMGEPFDNYDAVMRAVEILTDPTGLGFGPSRITISTSGRVDGIERMAREAHPALNLAVSVNAPSDAIRKKIMPVNQEWDLAALKEAMLRYSQHSRREILIEYVLLKGINDSLEAAEQLARYLEGLPVKVNLIPYNAQRRDRFAPPEPAQREAFLQALRAQGYTTLLRATKGDAVRAACGQLGNVEVRRNRVINKFKSVKNV